IFSVDDNSIYYVAPNVNKKTSPLSNIKVRQAIYAGIDVDALLKAIGRDGSIANQVVAQYIPGYNSAITRPKTDVAAAKQLLKDAGYPNGTSFTLTVYSGAQDAGQEIVRQLKDIGITVKLNSISDINQLEEGATNGTFEAYYFADGSIYNDANDVFSRNLQSKYYSNSKIDTLMDQAGTSLDQTKRLDDLKQISKLAMDDVALVPLYSNVPEWVAAKPYVMTQDLLSTDLGVLFYKVHLN
ncbi:MAG TPA: ABC transporter substrate-binding protein, partial [Candidatus Saccharimonadales bacterium]|nr:ABC transporter substrate-binding protein [Candidatus Saccharimonadales bacterium]